MSALENQGINELKVILQCTCTTELMCEFSDQTQYLYVLLVLAQSIIIITDCIKPFHWLLLAQEFLFDCTKPADWLYNSDTVTDASPKALAVQYARAALLNHLQARSPYVTDIVSAGA